MVPSNIYGILVVENIISALILVYPAVDWMYVSSAPPQNVYVEILIPNMMAVGSGAFGNQVMRVEPSQWD